VASIYARRQLAAMRESNQKQADSARNQELQLRASVLMSLDQRWETDPLISIRRELQDFITGVFDQCLARWPGTPLPDLRALTAPIFLSRLNEMEANDPAQHFRLFQICGFFETVGYVARAGYVSAGDVFNLLGGSVATAAMVFRPYISAKLHAGYDQHFYETFFGS
jgi:hypothetical protein